MDGGSLLDTFGLDAGWLRSWIGTEWETIGGAEDLDAAKVVLYSPRPVKEKPAEWDRPALGFGRGRHRRAASTEDGR